MNVLRNHRKGLGYVVTLWLIIVLMSMALSIGSGVQTQLLESANSADDVRVRFIEEGALRYVLQSLTDSDGELPDSTDMPACAVRLGDGAFWIIGIDLDGDNKQEFGLIPEGGRIDLNTASKDILLKLPGATDEIAAGIIDWRDEDEETTSSGAESDYYSRCNPSYQAHNASFETVDELRMVIGVDDDILYGADSNRDGMVSEDEDSASDVSDYGAGLAGTTSAWISWPDSDSDDTTDINSAEESAIATALTEACGETRAQTLAETIVEQRPYDTIFHLYYGVGLTAEEFEALEDTLTFGDTTEGSTSNSDEDSATFLLDVNAATKAALAALPGLEESDAQLLVQAREDSSSDDGSLAWMLDAISQSKLLEAVAAGVTKRSYQYTADILSVSADGRSFRRARYVIDVSNETPTVIYRQDLTHLGWPLDTEILERLRSGEDLDEVLSDAQAEEDTL